MKNPTVAMSMAFLMAIGMQETIAEGFLEIPQPNSYQSGIGVVSGWNCDAGIVEIEIDGRRLIPVAYGTERKDTEGVCGDSNNGFSFLLNYSGLGTGQHTIRAYADGVEFGSSRFTVQQLGQKFLEGVSGSFDLQDFPYPGQVTTIQWQEANQGFVFTEHSAGEPGFALEIDLITASLRTGSVYQTEAGHLVQITGLACGSYICTRYGNTTYDEGGYFRPSPSTLPNPTEGDKGPYFYLRGGDIAFAEYL